MSQRQWIVIIGAWVMVFLFLGLPQSWEKVLAILTGVVIIAFAYRIRFRDVQPMKDLPFRDTALPKTTDEAPSSSSLSENSASAQATPDVEK